MLILGQTIATCKAFFVDPTSSFGLAMVAADLGSTYTGSSMDGSEDIIYGAVRNGYGAGWGNTPIIVSKVLDINTDTCAALEAMRHNIEDGGVIYGDFCLGSKWEMEKAYENRTAAGLTFTSAKYWTSTEVDETHIYAIHMGTGVVTSELKTAAFLVRPIRKI